MIDSVPFAILAGGLATRLRPITLTIPKAMVEVVDRPFIDHQLELLAHNGVRKVVLCLGHMGEMVERHVGCGERFGLEVRYSHDGSRLLGTGGALRRALPLLGDTCGIVYGDSYLDVDYRTILGDFLASEALGLMTALRNDDRWDRSNLVLREGKPVFYSKRVAHPEMNHIDYGLTYLKREAIARIPEEQPFDLAELFTSLVAEGRMAGHEVQRRFFEIGSHQGLTDTEAYLRARAA